MTEMACPRSNGALSLAQDPDVEARLDNDIVCVSTSPECVEDSSVTVQPNDLAKEVPASGEDTRLGGLRIAKDMAETHNQNGSLTLADVEAATSTVTTPVKEENIQAAVNKSALRKGPPPGLLPLPPLTPENSRIPRQAALRSAERIKVITRAEEKIEDLENDILVLEDSTQSTSPGKTYVRSKPSSPGVTIRVITDPDMEFCKSCKKIACCAFKHEKNDSAMAFCSKQCVLQHFPKQDISFVKSNNEVVTDIPDMDGTLQDIVVEPDIEIQTLSDEFQMDYEDGDAIPNGSLTAGSSDDGVIEQAAKETFCCYSCKSSLYSRKDALNWEAMEFCSDVCLKTYMKVIGSHCNMCNQQVSEAYLGKLCVRFGTVIRQFCSSDCLDKFKAANKLCAQCQVNMPDKNKTYCSPACDELARRLNNKAEFYGRKSCSVCSVVRVIQDEIHFNGQSNWLCGRPCRNAFCFVNRITALDCGVCGRLFDAKATPRFALRDYSKGSSTMAATWFCSNGCFSTHLLKMRKIECCARCQVKKYNVDMIRRKSTTNTGVGNVATEIEMVAYFCSIFCYAYTLNPPKEDHRTLRKKAGEIGTPPVLKPIAPAASVRPIVSLQTTTKPTVVVPRSVVTSMNLSGVSIVGNTNGAVKTAISMPTRTQTPPIKTAVSSVAVSPNIANAMLPIELQHKVVFVPNQPKVMKNKAVWCRPSNLSQYAQISESTPTVSLSQTTSQPQVESPEMETLFEIEMEVENNSESTPPSASTSAGPESTSSGCQTEDKSNSRANIFPVFIPVPIPIYVPYPLNLYPLAFPLPLPIPTPVAFPIDPDLFDKMMKAIADSKSEQIQESVQLVPSTAEETAPTAAIDSIADPLVDDDNAEIQDPAPQTSNEDVQGTPIEATLPGSTDDSSPASPINDSTDTDQVDFETDLPYCNIQVLINNSRKRSNSTSYSLPSAKRIRDEDYNRSISDGEDPVEGRGAPSALDLKGAFRKDLGKLVWSQWVKSKKSIPYLSEMGVMELNSHLTNFVKELRRPNGESYRPDMLLYFIYGLQLSFTAGQRRENLLMEASLLPFQQELDKHLFPFYDTLVKGMNTDYLPSVSTSLKESHLWECRQLGCDSPIVLVFTMLYFNTKYFRLYTAEQHEHLSFSTIHKVIKRNSSATINGSGINSPTSRSANMSRVAIYALQLLCTVQQQNDLAAIGLKIKKPMETPQNTDRPTECPIKHYNFYLSKCPESVKTRKDAFYMVPESTCTPDSPFWYSSQPVPREMIARMLRRVLLIEEVLRNLCLSD